MSRVSHIIGCILILITSGGSYGQFTRQDSLRGSITAERAWWDLVYYDLRVEVSPENQSIRGSNIIFYDPVDTPRRMQIDLQRPMRIDSVLQHGKLLNFVQDGNAWFIETTTSGTEPDQLEVYFSGSPQVSENPPWSGGITWKKDKEGYPFIASSVQGDGASLWWPCKDHMYDEPDSMRISVRVPEGLMDVSNGQLERTTENLDGSTTWHWFVKNPINNYGVSINIARYVHFGDTYMGEKGALACDYYVLEDNLSVAKEQFKQVHGMLEAFEHWFGPYPFYEDGYKLIEAPYLGMEHQSAVTYGNGYRNGYRGMDLSQSGWGNKFDFIIIHESGHEWFANNITYRDIADMWIHESFTAYSENLYLDYHYGKEAAREYVIGTRINIQNDSPIIGPYEVNQSGSGDMYYKGANMLHMIRTLLNDDEKWRSILRGMNAEFYHQTVTTQQIEQYLIKESGLDLAPVFDQYLRDTRIPTLEYYFKDNYLYVRFTNSINDFHMDLPASLNGTQLNLRPTTQWSRYDMQVTPGKLLVPRDYYLGTLDILGEDKAD